MLKELKMLLGFAEDELNSERDKRLELIINNVRARLKLRLGGIEPPQELEHIIVEASVARYNQIGSEGIAKHGVEGENMEFSTDIFAPYEKEIKAFLDERQNHKGKVRFL